MKAVVNGQVVLEDSVLENGVVLFDQKIQAVGKDMKIGNVEVIDADGKYVIPGLIDMHIHGYCGDDVCDISGDSIKNIAKKLPSNGVTAWCPTTMTVDVDNIVKTLNSIRNYKDSVKGAKILGVNVEGPFINPAKKGAQSEENILSPDAEFILGYKDIVKLVTVAPEMEGGIDFVQRVTTESNITVSIGHTMADYSCTKKAIESGARNITHLFNAMSPLSHREVGVVGAALENDCISCEIIADTFHIDTALYKMLARAKGDKLILITDCMRAGGLSDGEYTLCGQTVSVCGIECRLKDGTIAGSVLKLNKAVYNFMKYSEVPIWQAVNMASLYPARVLGEDKSIGSISVGKAADIVIVDKKMDVISTFIDGEKII